MSYIGSDAQGLIANINGGTIENATLDSTVTFPARTVISFEETTYNTQTTMTSTSFTTLSDALSITITPKSSSSKFYLSANIPFMSTHNDLFLTTTFFRDDSDFINNSYGFGRTGDGGVTYTMGYNILSFSYLDEPTIPATPVAIKYSVAFKSNSTSTNQRIFDNSSIGTFILMEIQG